LTPLRRRIGIPIGNLFSGKLRRFARGYAEGRLGWDDSNLVVQS